MKLKIKLSQTSPLANLPILNAIAQEFYADEFLEVEIYTPLHSQTVSSALEDMVMERCHFAIGNIDDLVRNHQQRNQQAIAIANLSGTKSYDGLLITTLPFLNSFHGHFHRFVQATREGGTAIATAPEEANALLAAHGFAATKESPSISPQESWGEIDGRKFIKAAKSLSDEVNGETMFTNSLLVYPDMGWD